MKILLVAHGFPPEQVGGVELHTQALAFALARRGHTVLVVAGTLAKSSVAEGIEVRRERVTGEDNERIDVARIARHDLYFDHWHKSLDAGVARAFRDLLREFTPDVVHVQHWLRLSRDLVAVAAREGVPSVVTLHDAWSSCPIVFRVKPGTHEACDAAVGPSPCVKCAGRVPPRTPWIPIENGYLLLAERQRDIARELQLARAVITPSAAHARALERHLGLAEGALAAAVIAPCPPRAPRALAPRSADDTAVLRIATWSQIARHKGLDVLVEAFLAASAQLAGTARLELEILGAEAEPEFAASLRARTSGAPVRWKGAFPPADPGASLDARVALFVSASRAEESYGVSVDEAARLGLALLLPDAPAWLERCGGVAEFYARGDAGALAAKLVELAREPERLSSARNRALDFAARLPSLESIVTRHEEIYARALSAGAPTVAPASWFDARMASEATLAWDRALSSRTAAELGL
ncbi:MAG TPA: glycosyltransferase [Planctomycetota bacterium]|nr:glycosyltransferase [Planctomycetota bacterium]